jgi:membrane-bound ClpP family serine protease
MTRAWWNALQRTGLLLALAGLILAPAKLPAQNALADEGLFVTVPGPVTSEGVARLKLRVETARNNTARPARKIVFDFNPEGKEATAVDFGPSYELASYIQSLNGVMTVGFVSGTVTGHAVLPVLACQEIVAGKGAKLGEILPPGSDAPKPTVVVGYDEILDRGRDAYKAVVRKMWDRSLPMGRGTRKNAQVFVDLREKDALEKAGVKIPDPSPLPFGQPGTPGAFDAVALKTLGLVNQSADTRRDVAELYQLSAASLREDTTAERNPSGWKYTLRGEFEGGITQRVMRVVKDVSRQKGTHLFLILECSGGDVGAAQDLAQKLIEQRATPEAVHVVAVITDKAPDTAAIIALGCDEIVMSKRKDAKGETEEAEFGDFEAVVKGAPERVELLRKSLKDLAIKQGYPELLVDGFVDAGDSVVRVRAVNDRNRRKLLTGTQFEAEAGQWQSEGVVKPKGQLLKLNASKALELGVARFLIENRDPAEAYTHYGIDPTKVKEATPGFTDRLADFLRIPGVTVLLVVLGFAGLVLELKLPGVTVPGIIAALCFILLFWAHSQFTGQNAVLGGLVFLLGLVLILLEVFVIPGFGVTGILGVLFMLGGVGLATFEHVPQTGEEWTAFGGRLGQYVGAMLAGMVLAFVVGKFLPQIPYVNRLVLPPPPETPETPDLPGAAEAAAMLGAIGTSASPLRPAGMAQFGEKYVDVVSDGGFIASGARVQVIEVEGTRIVVKEV